MSSPSHKTIQKLGRRYNLEKKPDYRKQVNEELDRIEHRAMVLNDVLNSKSPQDRRNNDVNLDVCDYLCIFFW